MRGGHTNAFLLTPVSGPTIMITAPGSEIVRPGAMVTLQMQMNASESLTYQWLHDGILIPGATNSTLTLSGMNMGNAGQYTVSARNAIGTVANSSAAVSMFSMIVTNRSPHLIVAAPAGSHFRIDYSDSMGSSPNWQTMTNFTMTGAMSQMTVTPPPGSHGQFYRAVMMP
jgi:hypothetical protein